MDPEFVFVELSGINVPFPLLSSGTIVVLYWFAGKGMGGMEKLIDMEKLMDEMSSLVPKAAKSKLQKRKYKSTEHCEEFTSKNRRNASSDISIRSLQS